MVTSLQTAPAAVLPDDARPVGMLAVVDFRQDGNSAAYRTSGWSAQETAQVWTTAGAACLRLPCPPESADLVLEIDLSIVRQAPLLLAGVARIFVNDLLVAATRMTGRSLLRCRIPAAAIHEKNFLDVRLENPCAVSINHFGTPRDDRTLGLCVYGLVVYHESLAALAANVLSVPKDIQRLIAQPVHAIQEPLQSAHASYTFGRDRPDRRYLGQGWYFDPDGNAWVAAAIATLDLPAPTGVVRYIATFRLSPLYLRHKGARQRISILLNGAVIGQFTTGSAIAVSVALPPELIEPGANLCFTLIAPDGIRLGEFDKALDGTCLSFILDQVDISPVAAAGLPLVAQRADDVLPHPAIAVSGQFLDEPPDQIPAAVMSALGSTLPKILALFESLGDNCAFGLAQRKGGSDAMALLRFANTPLQGLLRALEDEFSALRDPDRLTLEWDGGEFVVKAPEYGIRWHTNINDESANRSDLIAQQVMRLGYLRGKFYESLRSGRKIWTISRAEPHKHPIPLPSADELKYWEEWSEGLRLAELVVLFQKLNTYGQNSLLYLTRCQHGRRSGTVELLAPGIMHGHVGDLVITGDIAMSDHSEWMRIAANAWLLDKGPDAPFRNRSSS